MTRILFATSEVHPLIKTGGLADVSASLPAALQELGQDVRLLIPGYTPVLEGLTGKKTVATFSVFPGQPEVRPRHGGAEPSGAGVAASHLLPQSAGYASNVSEVRPRHGGAEPSGAGVAASHLLPQSAGYASNVSEVRLLSAKMPGTQVPVYVLDAPQYFCRVAGPYQYHLGGDWPDNPMRFGMLSKVAAMLGSADSPIDWQAELVHCNDWQTGLVPAYLQSAKGGRAKTVMTIHNIAFQGNFDRDWMKPLNLPPEFFHMQGVEFHGNLSFLKSGLQYADRIVTVSPTYAHEIQATEMGCGMQGLLTVRKADVSGILNGIDLKEWDPATDKHLMAHYDDSDLLPKTKGKLALQKRLGLEVNEHAPLLGVVSRLTYQKGLDLLLECLPALMESGAQLAVLGTGDPEIERRYQQLAQRYAGRVSATIGFSEELSHQIMAGADIFLMPSRFEPCGLNQMYGMRYGTPPVVRRTGGLADSVTNASLEGGTGFVFDDPGVPALQQTIKWAIECYRDPDTFRRIQLNGMHEDFGWRHSAQLYLDLYDKILKG